MEYRLLKHTFLCGSSILMLAAVAAAQQKQPAAPNQAVAFHVFLPLQNQDALQQLIAAQHTSGSPQYRHWLTADQFAASYGANRQAIAQVSSALGSYGLKVTSTDAHGMQVQGTAAAVESAFGTKLFNTTTPNGTQMVVSSGALTMPPPLAQAGASIAAFSPAVRHHTHSRQLGVAPANRYSPEGPYWFTDLKQAYDFPSYQALTGRGRTIGIVMASDFLDSDIQAYFAHERLAPPKIVRVPINGGAQFDPNNGASFEVSLDIQQAGGMAPGATIVVYIIPDLSDASIIAAYQKIVESNAVDIVSSSFGGAEGFYTAAYNGGTDYTGLLRAYDEIFEQGNAQGITFVASSGDSGGLGLPSVGYFAPPQNPPAITAQFLPGIEWPASSPHVTAVGGTNLVTASVAGSRISTYVRENAYGDPEVPYDPYGLGNLVAGGYWGSGGGTSVVFHKPLYQFFVNTGANMRSIPDVSLQMGGCPFGISASCGPEDSAVIAAVGGFYWLLIGTSASAPDFAGLLALEEENLGGVRLGNVNYQIYALAAAQNVGLYKAFHQGIPGFNGYFSSQQGVPGYNMVVGNGTTLGRGFIFALGDAPAGNPQTPSNP